MSALCSVGSGCLPLLPAVRPDDALESGESRDPARSTHASGEAPACCLRTATTCGRHDLDNARPLATLCPTLRFPEARTGTAPSCLRLSIGCTCEACCVVSGSRSGVRRTFSSCGAISRANLPAIRTAKIPIVMRPVAPRTFRGFSDELKKSDASNYPKALLRTWYCRAGIETLYVGSDGDIPRLRAMVGVARAAAANTPGSSRAGSRPWAPASSCSKVRIPLSTIDDSGSWRTVWDSCSGLRSRRMPPRSSPMSRSPIFRPSVAAPTSASSLTDCASALGGSSGGRDTRRSERRNLALWNAATAKTRSGQNAPSATGSAV